MSAVTWPQEGVSGSLWGPGPEGRPRSSDFGDVPVGLWAGGGGHQLTSKCVSMALGRGVWGAHAQTHAPGGEEPVDLP